MLPFLKGKVVDICQQLISEKLQFCFTQFIQEQIDKKTIKSRINEIYEQHFDAQKISISSGLAPVENLFESNYQKSQYNLDFEGLKEYLLGEGYESISQIVRTPYAERENPLQCSLLHEAYYNANAKTKEDMQAIESIIAAIISIVRDFFLLKCDPKDIVLAKLTLSSVNKRLDEQSGKIDALSNTLLLNNIKTTPIAISSDKEISSYLGIRRYVTSYNFSSDDKEYIPLFDVNKEALWDALMSEKHIVLIGAAGDGKTYALDQLFIDAKANGYEPVYLELKNYPCMDSLDQLFAPMNTVPMQTVIILDGFDEIATEKISEFCRAVNGASRRLENIPIIISSRRNFYRQQNADQALLRGFKCFSLCPITGEDRSRYAIEQGVNYQEFVKVIYNKGLSELYQNPFYFVELIKYWKESQTLPNRAGLMQAIVERRIVGDIAKYVNEIQMEDEEQEIIKISRIIAFLMQCIHRTELTEEQYHSIVNKENRSLLKHVGLWKKNNKSTWSFEHNIFREYFAAEYLNRFKFDEILRYILVDSPSNSIRPSWQNTVGFLSLLREPGDLKDWIAANNPALLVYFEKDRISKETSIIIFKQIMERHEREQTWLQNEKISIAEIVSFADYKETVEYVLCKLKAIPCERHTLNLLRTLNEYKSLYGLETDAQTILITIACDQSISQYIRSDAINVLATHGFFGSSYMDTLVDMYKNTSDLFVLDALYRYILESKKASQYTSVFLWGVEHSNTFKETLYGIYNGIREGQMAANTKESLLQIFIFYCDHPGKLMQDENNKVYQTCCHTAATIGNEVEKQFIPILTKSLPIFLDSGARNAVTAIKEFMIEANATEAFLSAILLEPNPEQWLIIEDLMCDELARLLLIRYQNKQLPEMSIIPLLATRMNGQESWYTLFRDAIQQVTGEDIPKNQWRECAKQRPTKLQRYFDALWSPHLFSILVQELIDVIGEDVLVKDIFNTKKELYQYHDVECCAHSLCHWFSGNEEIHISEYRSSVQWNWKRFTLYEIHRMLTNYKTDISISEKQQKTLQARCLEEAETIDFKTIAIENGSSYQFSRDHFVLLRLLALQNIKCSEKQFLSMLMVPPILISGDSSTSIPEYIVQNLSPELLHKQIVENVRNEALSYSIACSHMEYCASHKLDDAKNLAIDYILRESATYYYPALNYFFQQFGAEGIYNYILPKCKSDELLGAISRMIPLDEYSEELDRKILEALHQTQFESSLLILCIKRNMREAVTAYYEKAKNIMKLPDYPSHNSIPSITESIAAIDSIDLLGDVYDLLELSCEDDFQDVDFWGLRGSAMKSMRNIADYHYTDVVSFLSEKAQNGNINQKLELTIIDIQEDIKISNKTASDIPMLFDDAWCAVKAMETL